MKYCYTARANRPTPVIRRDPGVPTWVSHFPTAAVLLDAWERPWAPKILRFAANRITMLYHLDTDTILTHTLDVLEHERQS